MDDNAELIEEVSEHLSGANGVWLDEHVARLYREDVPRLLAALSRPVPDDTTGIVERAFEQICRDEPLSGISRSDIQKWVDLLSPLLTPPVPVTGGVDLEAIEARVNAATPGPWYIDDSTGVIEIWSDEVNDLIVGDAADGYYPPNKENAYVLAVSRSLIPALIAEVRALRSRLSPPTREEPSAVCEKRIRGSVPAWAGEDQIDPCLCVLPKGHDGDCECDHTRSSSPETEGEKNK